MKTKLDYMLALKEVVVWLDDNFSQWELSPSVRLPLLKELSQDPAFARLLRGSYDHSSIPDHQLENYQHFLGLVADAAGVTGSPSFDEVLDKIRLRRGGNA